VITSKADTGSTIEIGVGLALRAGSSIDGEVVGVAGADTPVPVRIERALRAESIAVVIASEAGTCLCAGLPNGVDWTEFAG
jgi:hypothetical protein